MSRKGDCWDNAVVESFFGSLKKERVQWKCYQTGQEAMNDILQYIAIFYNESRLHSHLDCRYLLNWLVPKRLTTSSWLNAVEGWFAQLERRALYRGVFNTATELQ